MVLREFAGLAVLMLAAISRFAISPSFNSTDIEGKSSDSSLAPSAIAEMNIASLFTFLLFDAFL